MRVSPEVSALPGDLLRRAVRRMEFSKEYVGKALRRHGLSGCAKLLALNAVAKVRDRLPKRRKYLREYFREQYDFDRELNIKTWHSVALRDLQIDSPDQPFGTNHEPSAVRFVTRFFDHLALNFEAFTFIDLGSGLGRSVFVASSLAPFRRAIGIEFAPQLHGGALENLTSCRRDRLKCVDIEFLCQDAGEYVFPPDPLVVHLFNPFGVPVIQKLVERLERSILEADREIYVLYRNSTETRDECVAVFERCNFLHRIWSEPFFTIWSYQPVGFASNRAPDGRAGATTP